MRMFGVCVCEHPIIFFFFTLDISFLFDVGNTIFFRETKKKLICFGIEFFTTFSFTVFFSDSIAYILLLLLWSLWIYNYSMHILIQHGHIIIHRTRELFPWLFRHSFNGKKKNSPFSLLLFFFVKQKNQKFFTLFKWWCESLFYRIFHHSIFLASNFHFISFLFFVIFFLSLDKPDNFIFFIFHFHFHQFKVLNEYCTSLKKVCIRGEPGPRGLKGSKGKSNNNNNNVMFSFSFKLSFWKKCK